MVDILDLLNDMKKYCNQQINCFDCVLCDLCNSYSDSETIAEFAERRTDELKNNE